MKFFYFMTAMKLFFYIFFLGYICGIIFVIICQFQEDFIFQTSFKESFGEKEYAQEYMITSKGYKDPTLYVALTATWNAMILLTNNQL